MSKTTIYAGLAVVGAILPLVFLVPWAMAHGLNLKLFATSLFVNGASGMLTVDLLFSALVFWVWMFQDSRQHNVSHIWLPILATLGVGLSLALPLYLLMRERRLNQQTA